MVIKPVIVLLFLLSPTLVIGYPKLVIELEECKYDCIQREKITGQQLEECAKQCTKKLQGKKQQPGFVDAQEHDQQHDENPYFFPPESFKSLVKSQEGSIEVLERFSKGSNLLLGIDNYRLELYEGNPNTFNLPHYWDVDLVCVVLKGRGSMTLIEENNKKTYSLVPGEILRVRPGVIVYLVNNDNNEKLQIVTLIQPISTLGKFKTFLPAGGSQRESVYNAFSSHILKAAFNISRAKMQRLFHEQSKGAIIRASPEQIQALSRPTIESSPWLPPFKREPKGTFNLFNKRSSLSNQFGKLYQADRNDYQQLQELDLGVSSVNITKGSMCGPHYNSRATEIAVVVDGSGYIEMSCPHISSSRRWKDTNEERDWEHDESDEGISSKYKRVSAHVSRGDVFVIPAGNPVVAVASGDQNFQVMSFMINAENNKRIPLAGKDNIMKQLEREAKELSFDIPAKQVDEIFQKQDQSWFFPGPNQYPH